MTDSVCLAVYHHALKTTCTWMCKCTNHTGNVANSDAILPQINRIGIFGLLFSHLQNTISLTGGSQISLYTWWPHCNCLEWRAQLSFSKHMLSKNCSALSNCCKPTNFRGLNFCCLEINCEIYIPQKFQCIQWPTELKNTINSTWHHPFDIKQLRDW